MGDHLRAITVINNLPLGIIQILPGFQIGGFLYRIIQIRGINPAPEANH